MINKKKFETLASTYSKPCISIYFPTHRANGKKADQIHLKNGLKEAANQLESLGYEEGQIKKILRPAQEWLQDDNFWNKLSDGLAIFLKEDSIEYFTLPLSFEPFVYVGEKFYLRPLLSMFSGDGRFFVLALSQNEVRFFEGTRHSISPVIIEDLVPESMEEALNFQNTDEALQAHSGLGNTSIYHGHGAGKDDKVKNLSKYFNRIDDGLMNMLHDEDAPMVIAAVDYLVPIFREVSNYTNIMDVSINGNPEDNDPVLLHEKAWPIVKDYFQQARQTASEHFTQYLSEDKASFFTNDIVVAAINGKVDTLFNVVDYQLWGQFDPQTQSVTIHEEKQPNSICLLEMAAVQTFLQGGKVFNVKREEMPQPTANLNAVYRY